MRSFQLVSVQSAERGVSRARLCNWPLLAYFFLFLLPSISFAATGFTYSGQCYSTEQAALDAYVQSFPQNSGGFSLDLASATVSAGVVSFTINSKSLTSGTGATVSGNATFQPCNYDVQGWEQVKTSGLVFYVALVLCFFIGLRMGWLL